MPIHDWTRVTAGIFHHFHLQWLGTISDALNIRCLPPGYYALVAEPQVRFTAETEVDEYVLKQNTLVIHHSSGDKVIALVEIVSPGNKASRHGLRTLVEKAAAALYRGYHLLVLDLHPTGPRDPNGIHGAIWEEIADASYRQPSDKPLSLVAYSAGAQAGLHRASRGRQLPPGHAAVLASWGARPRATGRNVSDRLAERAATLASSHRATNDLNGGA